MPEYTFMMKCGHKEVKEVADPTKYYNVDRDYYAKFGLCDKCWGELHGRRKLLRDQKEAQAALGGGEGV